jgi:hypothetical protein
VLECPTYRKKLHIGQAPVSSLSLFVSLLQLGSVGTNLHVGVSEYELPHAGVEHESVDPVAVRDDDHGGAPVQRVPGCHYLPEDN